MSMLSKPLTKKVLRIFQILFIMVWVANLSATDAYFSVYVLIGFAGFYCLLKQQSHGCLPNRKTGIVLALLSVLFSLMVIAANYSLFTLVRDPSTIQASTNRLVNLINVCFTFLGGIAVSCPVLTYLVTELPVCLPSCDRSDREKAYRVWAFGSFLLLSAIYLIHLFLVEYPGNVTEDPFSQIGEMVSGNYSNFNTFWHTIVMQQILSAGYGIFGDVNAAVALFCTVQALVMAYAFSYCLGTLYLSGMPRTVLIAVLLVYAVLPYHIALSITIWKDVLFSGGCLLTVCALYRILRGLGSRSWKSYAVLIFGGFLFCLSRNNGWYIYLAALLISAVPLWKNKKVLVSMICVFLISYLLCGPVLKALNVAGGDYTESLSIPLQQVARVVTEGHDLTEDEEELLSQVFDLEELPEIYVNWISDPVKIAFRDNNPEYFESHVPEYVSLWLRLGARYPGAYFRAWVDQTKGYWNAGYPVALYSETVTDNPYGVEKTGQHNLVARLFGLYFGLSRHVIFFQPLHSIGLHSWLMALCCILNMMKKRRDAALLTVLPLVLILGLCIGTPVYSTFRYAYPVFACLPLIAPLTVYSREG